MARMPCHDHKPGGSIEPIRWGGAIVTKRIEHMGHCASTFCLARYATMAIKRLQYNAVNGCDFASTWMDPLRSFLAVPQNIPVGSTLCGPKMDWVSLVFLSTVSLILHRSITKDSACAPPIHSSTGKFGVLTICKLEVAVKVRDSQSPLTTPVSAANRLILYIQV